MEHQSKNLVIFSDGTGNRGGVTNDTNVWRLYQMVSSQKHNQLTFYDDGVGTSNIGLFKMLSGALGIGLSHNIKQMYEFLVRNYHSGDKIYLFGFSRGAYTVRCLLGLLNKRGLVNRYKPLNDENGCASLKNEDALRAEIKHNFDLYRSDDPEEQDKDRDGNTYPVTAEFIGVWDTVDAVGMPIDELKAIDLFIWKIRGKRAFTFNDRTLRGVKYARQALAIDDERRTFHPNYWLGCSTEIDMEQVWFVGMHSNVGGSYPKDGLAYVTLEWMIEEIRQLNLGLLLPQEQVDDVRNHANAHDKMYDSRSGFAVFYRYAPRNLLSIRWGKNSFWFRQFSKYNWFMGFSIMKQVNQAGPKIKVHQSVWRRIVRGTGNYAPLFVHDDVTFAHTANSKSPYSEESLIGDFPKLSTQMPTPIETDIDDIEKEVSKKQAAYLVFVSFAISLIIHFVFFVDKPSPVDSFGARFFKNFTPDLLSTFVDKLFSNPILSTLSLATLIGLYAYSTQLNKVITTKSRRAWVKAISGYLPCMKSTNSADHQEDG
ncbi:MAG: DUF2235 domain-containing protein [Motiliproteus sp.]